jgi:hypothetical protein
MADIAGGIATELGQKAYRAEADAQALEGIAAVKARMLTEFDTHDTNPDHTTYQKGFDKAITDLDNIPKGLTNRRGRLQVEQFIKANKPIWQDNVNDSVIKRQNDNVIDTTDRWPERIKDLDLSSIDGQLEAQWEIGQAGAARLKTGRFTPAEVETWTENALRTVENQSIFQEAEKISLSKGYEKGVDHIMKQKIGQADKERIVNDVKFNASQRQLAYDQQLEKIEVDYLKRLGQEQLSENALMADLQAGRIDPDLYKEYSNYVEAQTAERLKGEKERDWDTYKNLQGMVKDYGDGARTDERVIRDAISEAVKAQKITAADGMKLLDRVKKSDDTDDPMNRSDAKRGLGIFNSLEAAEISANIDEPYDVIRDIRLKYQKKKDEYENWIKRQDKLTGADIQKKTAEMTEGIVAEEVPKMIERAFNIWVQSPFGVLYRKAKGIEKKGKEEPAETDLSQLTDEELDAELEKLK